MLLMVFWSVNLNVLTWFYVLMSLYLVLRLLLTLIISCVVGSGTRNHLQKSA